MDENGNDPKRKRVKRTFLSEVEEENLIDIWRGYEVLLRKCKRNSHVNTKMAKEMSGKFSAQLIFTKTRNLKQKYRLEKQEIGPSGGSLSKWKFYEKVHQIVGSNASNSNEIIELFEYNTSSSLSIPSPTSMPPESPSAPWLDPPTPTSCDDTPSSSETRKKRKMMNLWRFYCRRMQSI